MEKLRFVGLDVHARTITVAVAESGGGEVRSLGTIPNDPEAVRRLVKQLGPVERLRVCYEAGPTGFVLYWQLTRLGVACVVVAPTLIPVRASDRVKTDRRDALKLARCLRAGDLTAAWVPDAAHEALRDLVRAREAATQDHLRARHRLRTFLLRHGHRPPRGVRAGSQRYQQWLQGVTFALSAQTATFVDYQHEVTHVVARLVRLERALDDAIASAPAPMRAVIAALQALRGVAQVTAATLVAEVGPVMRFGSARQLMGYAGYGVREDSSGARIRRGGITKTGNAHVRRCVGEVAWHARRRPALGPTLRARQVGLDPAVREMAWTAQHRLARRYAHLVARGKSPHQAATAVAREVLGFVWAIGQHTERAALASA